MKIFVIGGLVSRNSSSEELLTLERLSAKIGEMIVSHGHDLSACSPFSDSVDFHAVKAAVEIIGRNNYRTKVELHHPDNENIVVEIKKILSAGNSCLRRYPHPPLGDIQYSWLFSQLKALDTANGIIALGGKSNGVAQLLLEFANVRDKAILPLKYMGGAAADFFDMNRWSITDSLNEKVDCLNDSDLIEEIPSLIEVLVNGRGRVGLQNFFISYSRDRPQEADYIEVLLNRRGLNVFRDEKDFEPSALVQSEIFKNIRNADVFIAVWCKEYACSPWCFDELEYALECKEGTELEIWLFVVDETRVVPPKARGLVYYKASTRTDIEGFVLNLLGRQ